MPFGKGDVGPWLITMSEIEHLLSPHILLGLASSSSSSVARRRSLRCGTKRAAAPPSEGTRLTSTEPWPTLRPALGNAIRIINPTANIAAINAITKRLNDVVLLIIIIIGAQKSHAANRLHRKLRTIETNRWCNLQKKNENTRLVHNLTAESKTQSKSLRPKWWGFMEP